MCCPYFSNSTMASRLGPPSAVHPTMLRMAWPLASFAHPRGMAWNGAGGWVTLSQARHEKRSAHGLDHGPLARHHLQRLGDVPRPSSTGACPRSTGRRSGPAPRRVRAAAGPGRAGARACAVPSGPAPRLWRRPSRPRARRRRPRLRAPRVAARTGRGGVGSARSAGRRACE